MMNTLHPRAILEKLALLSTLAELKKTLRSGPWPVDTGELDGSLAAAIIALLSGETAVPRGIGRIVAGTILVVVPTDQEAETFSADLAAYGVEADILPWWKTAAYRPSAQRNRIFGERAAVLARMASGAASLVIASQRAFVTPVPPPGSFSPLVIALSVGGAIDPNDLGERLAC
ncbi:MAG: hypothetical protein WCL50_14480 [Spirochaetota bacterium]